MKKPAKLLFRKETLRTLTEAKLAYVVAGSDAGAAFAGPGSDLKHCVAEAVVAG